MQDLQSVYETIADNIRSKEGQCVLLLGPELSVDKDGIDYKAYFKNLVESESDSILKYFHNENLFLLKDGISPRGIRKLVKEFYSNVGDPVLLEMISRLKIPLIINASPDTSLNKVFDEKHYAYKPGYFSIDPDPTFQEIPIPTKDVPAIINIFGSVEKDLSLILTHDKLYETIECLLQDNSLPRNIELFIKGASSFIFLGFKFDSWHYQLLCHKLEINNADKTILSSPNCSFNEEVSFIMKNHFKMDFTCENPVQAIERIIQNCEGHEDECLRPKSQIGKFGIYLSYARKDDSDNSVNRESIVDKLKKEFECLDDHVIHIYQDKNELTFGDSIDSFMNRIGKGKTAIRIISDKYLKSRFCMDEAIRMYKYNDNEKRIYTVMLDDVPSTEEQIRIFKKFWKDKCETIFREIDENIEDIIHREELKRNYNIYLDIYSFIDKFLNKIKDEIHLKVKLSSISSDENGDLIFETECNEEIKSFVNTVIKKMKEN
jgi:hypothetical protein